jgi:divalent metal cation (Fe/Co/Zn/Cd) transporter
VTVSSLLLVGAIGIGWHSFDLLMATIQSSAPLITSTTTATTAAIVSNTGAEHATVAASPIHGHGHGHEGGVLDPNAAWFALASVIIKEWLYRASKVSIDCTERFQYTNLYNVAIKVGISERSEVLMANAW